MSAPLPVQRFRKFLPGDRDCFPKDFQVEDGTFTAFGVPSKVREGDEIIPVADRARKLMNVLGTGISLEHSVDLEAQRTKNSLQPGQKLGQVLVPCVCRPDYGHRFIEKLRDVGVEIVGTPIIFNAGFLYIALASSRELVFMYKIVE